MKKTLIAGAGVAALAMAALPMAGVFATDVTGPTDTVTVTVADNCSLVYRTGTDTPSHADGGTGDTDGKWGTGQSANTLTTAIATGGVNKSMGQTYLVATCNDNGNSKVTVTATTLKDSTTSKEISLSASEPTAGTASWGIYNSSTWLASGGVVKSYTGATAADTITITYGAALAADTAAGTYTGTAAYTLTHPVK